MKKLTKIAQNRLKRDKIWIFYTPNMCCFGMKFSFHFDCFKTFPSTNPSAHNFPHFCAGWVRTKIYYELGWQSASLGTKVNNLNQQMLLPNKWISAVFIGKDPKMKSESMVGLKQILVQISSETLDFYYNS